MREPLEVRIVPAADCYIDMALEQWGPIGWYRVAMHVIDMAEGEVEPPLPVCQVHYDEYVAFMEGMIDEQ